MSRTRAAAADDWSRAIRRAPGSENRAGRFNLIFAIEDASSHDAVALAERRFSRSDSSVGHHWLQVVKSSQKRRFGAQLIAALLPLYETLGIYAVRITAGLSPGDAIWGKFGFAPDADEWARIRPIIQVHIGTVMLQRGLPRPSREACEAGAWLAKD